MDNEETSGLGLGLNALFDEEDIAVSDDNSVDEIIEEIDEIIEEIQEDISDVAAEMDTAATSNTSDTRKRYNVGIAQLYPSRFQPRNVFYEESLNDLADSIKQYGVLQPLLVREDPENPDNYEIIAGERRWRAAQKAQLHDVPVVVLSINELEAFKIALIENLQREDLDPIDEALGYKKLLENYGQTQDGLAKAVGKSRPHITNMVRLLSLPDIVQAHLSAGDLSMGHARALITAQDPEGLANQIISKGLSVRQTEKFAAEKKGTTQQSRPRAASPSPALDNAPATLEKDADTLALENDMSNALGMNVKIDSPDGHSGKLSIEFKSLDQLDELLHRLAHFPGSRLNG